VIPTPFRALGYEIRSTTSWVQSFAQSVSIARQLRAEQWIINLLEANYTDVFQANKEKGRTTSGDRLSESVDRVGGRDVGFGRRRVSGDYSGQRTRAAMWCLMTKLFSRGGLAR